MEYTVDLVDKKQFRVMLHPVRQEMIHRLRLLGRPMSANELAQKLQLSPSSAQSHLRKLVTLGIVSELQRVGPDGTTLYFYQAKDVRLRLCLGRKDAFQGEREALAANLTDGTFRSLLSTSYRHDEQSMEEYGILRFGTLHLSTQQRKELMALIDGYLERQGIPNGETEEHWEYVLMTYRAEQDL